MYNALLDDRDIVLWRSPSEKVHVASWFGAAACGAHINSHDGWNWHGLTSLRTVGRMSRKANVNKMCKRCAAHYKDVRDD